MFRQNIRLLWFCHRDDALAQRIVAALRRLLGSLRPGCRDIEAFEERRPACRTAGLLSGASISSDCGACGICRSNMILCHLYDSFFGVAVTIRANPTFSGRL
jgi:hypothetical protein